jgi:hypothetical protein
MKTRTKDRKIMTALHVKVMENIARTGRHIMGVFPTGAEDDPINAAFQYTIGNSLKKMPELLIVGMYDDLYAINALSQLMIVRGRKFEDGEVVSLGGPFAVCVVDASEDVKRRFTIQVARQLCIEDAGYAVMQVVLPDKRGRFPWQIGCAAPFSKVKVWRANKLN